MAKLYVFSDHLIPPTAGIRIRIRILKDFSGGLKYTRILKLSIRGSSGGQLKLIGSGVKGEGK